MQGESRHFVRMLGVMICRGGARQEIWALFDQADLDGSGLIEFNEFVQMM